MRQEPFCGRDTPGADRRARPGVGTRGQSLLEFALALPVFLALLFGTIELGMLYKTHAAYQEATQEAVRVAAAAGVSSDADLQTLNELQSVLPVENLRNIASVTIYDATITGAFAVTPTLNDNAHTDYIFSAGANGGAGGFVCADAGHEAPGTPCSGESYWDPTTRRTAASTLDRVGIQVQYLYKSATGALPLVHISQTASELMEPTSY